MAKEIGKAETPSPEELLDGETAVDTTALEAAMDAEDLEPGIDPNHPVLTVEEQRAALKAAANQIQKEKRQAALREIQEKAELRLRGALGQSTGDAVRDELVYITLDLPDYTPDIKINGRAYEHGRTYQVPRHVADTLRDQQSQCWKHQNEIEGKNIADRFRRPVNRVLSGGEAVR